MRNTTIIRAWKDEFFRESLSENVRASLPENPAGLIELEDSELGEAVGGGSFFVAAESDAQFCTTPCTTSLACNPCTGGGIRPPGGIKPPKVL